MQLFPTTHSWRAEGDSSLTGLSDALPFSALGMVWDSREYVGCDDDDALGPAKPSACFCLLDRALFIIIKFRMGPPLTNIKMSTNYIRHQFLPLLIAVT